MTIAIDFRPTIAANDFSFLVDARCGCGCAQKQTAKVSMCTRAQDGIPPQIISDFFKRKAWDIGRVFLCFRSEAGSTVHSYWAEYVRGDLSFWIYDNFIPLHAATWFWERYQWKAHALHNNPTPGDRLALVGTGAIRNGAMVLLYDRWGDPFVVGDAFVKIDDLRRLCRPEE
ncbi:MAG: hypothetical protein AMXMBFR58_18870 [Phycisphaerae bacterium]